MKIPIYFKIMFFLSVGGLLFSGYLSAIKLFTSTCAFNEPCPYFLGYPACWYGFFMFLIIFSSATLSLFEKISKKNIPKIIAAVSFLGILFAGYFTVPEIGRLISGAQDIYTLGIPTCAYGLVFYIIIFVLSIRYLKKGQNLN